jgi:antitoxin component of RelBE/YafQ-DinJ toxin-antitoxin module
MLGKKSSRIHIRVTNETRMVWLKLCEQLHGATQSQVFRILIEKVAKETETAVNCGQNTI